MGTNETVREVKDAIVEAVPQLRSLFEPTVEAPKPETTKPKPVLAHLLAEAPALFGCSPTATQIEEFKEKEIIWRSKLASL